MQQTIQGDCTELTAFVCEHLSVCSHKPFFWKAACCIHHPHRKHEQGQLFLGPLLFLFSGKVVQGSPFFASVLLQIKLSTLKLQSVQNNTFVTKNQEPKLVFAIFLCWKQWIVSPSRQNAVCQTPQPCFWYLSNILEMVLQFLHPKHYMKEKCSPCTHLKPFSIYLFHLKRDSLGNSIDINWENSNVFESQVKFLFLVIHTAKNHHLMLFRLVNSLSQ